MKLKLTACVPIGILRGMDNKNKILASALKLFGAKGYDATGVQEIACLSGITKPTLYYYFGSKKGLLEVLLTRYNQKLNKKISAAALYEGDLQKSLTKVATIFFKFAQNNKDFYRMQLAMVFGPLEGEPIKIIGKLANTPYQILQELFSKAVKSKGEREAEIYMAYAITFIGIVHQYITLFLNGFIELSEEIADFIVSIFLHGIDG